MPYQETSAEAYDSIQTKINRKQSQVLAVLQMHKGGLTNCDLAAHLQWPINTVTPRVLELRGKGWITENGYGINKSGRRAIVWKYQARENV